MGRSAAMLIRIRAANEAGTHPVEAELDDGSTYLDGSLQLDQSRLLGSSLDVEAYGNYLFDALFAGSIGRAYERAMGRADGNLRVLIWIDDGAPELHAISWERIHHLHKGRRIPLAASTQTPFCRYLGLEAAVPVPLETRPARILVAVSNPSQLPPDLAPIDVAAEIDNLRAALGDLRARGDVAVTLVPGRTGLPAGVAAALEGDGYAVVQGPTSLVTLWRTLPGHHVLHLLGHGSFRRGEESPGGRSALFLERDDGTRDIVRDDDLVAKLAATEPLPRVAFLAACETAAPAGNGVHPFLGLGPKLLRAGIPAVVAMQDVIPMESARLLSHDFYRHLAEHGRVDLALNQARLVLFEGGETAWTVPVLFNRVRDGMLFYPRADSNRVATATKVVDPSTPGGIRVDELADPPALRPRRGPVVVLPRRPREPLGRAAEIDDALDLLESRASLELVGTHGVGKTTLLNHLLHHAPVVAPDGIVHVARGTRTETDLLRYLFEALFETDRNYVATDSEMRRMLSDRRVLFAVDDADLGREQIQVVLDGAPQAIVLLAAAERNVWQDADVLMLRGLPPPECVTLFESELGRVLRPPERSAVEVLAAAVDGNPLKILQAAGLVRDEGVDIDALGEEFQGMPAEGVLEPAIEHLTLQERAVLSSIAALEGAPIHLDHIAGATGIADPLPVVEGLERRHFVRSASPRYAIADPPGRAAREALELGEWTERLAAHFEEWLDRNEAEPGLVLGHADSIVALLGRLPARGAAHGRLVRGVEGALIVGRRWGEWHDLMQRERDGAADPARRAWALHQLGSRALSLDDHGAARDLLGEALRMRQALGDNAGAAVTRHNLELVEPGPIGFRPPWKPLLLVAVVVALVLGALFLLRGDAVLEFDPGEVDFGEVDLGGSRTESVELSISGETDILVTNVSVEPALDDYRVAEDCSGRALGPEQTCTIEVTFRPTLTGERATEIVVTASTEEGEQRVPVRGVGVPPSGAAALEVDPGALEFGPHRVDETSPPLPVTISSTGDADLDVRDVRISEGDDFEVVTDECSGRTLSPDDSCLVEVVFHPREPGERRAELVIESNAGEAPHVVPLAGEGEAEIPNLVIEQFGQTDDSYTSRGNVIVPVTVTVANRGTGPAVDSLVAAFYTSADGEGSEPRFVPFGNSDGEIQNQGLLLVGPLPEGTTSTIDGFLVFPFNEQGSTVTIVAIADSCHGQEIDDPPCRITESNEDDNLSPGFETILAQDVVD